MKQNETISLYKNCRHCRNCNAGNIMLWESDYLRLISFTVSTGLRTSFTFQL